MKRQEAMEILNNGNYETRNSEIKTRCIVCGKPSWIEIKIAATAMSGGKHVKCSLCGDDSLWVVKKKNADVYCVQTVTGREL